MQPHPHPQSADRRRKIEKILDDVMAVIVRFGITDSCWALE